MGDEREPPAGDLFADYDPERMPKRLAIDGVVTFTSPTWLCPVHGETRLVFTIFCPGQPGLSYCMPCAIALLERLGLPVVNRID